MKLRIEPYSGQYMIANTSLGLYYDYLIAEILELELDEYREILIKYNGVEHISEDIIFDLHEDAENALNSDELLPRLIMLNLL